MTGLGDLRSTVDATRAALTECEDSLRQSGDEADDLAESAANRGWEGVGRTMADARDRIQVATIALAAAEQALASGAAVLTRIDDTVSSDDVAQGLATLEDRIREATTAVDRSLNALDDASASVTRAGAGRMTAWLSTTRRALAAGRALLESALAAVDSERSAAAGWGKDVGGTSVAGTAPRSPADARSGGRIEPSTAGWIRNIDSPEEAKDVLGAFRPRPPGANRPTTGLFRGERLESGGRDRTLAADLVHDPLRGPPVTFYQHVEAKAAARMRRENLSDAHLYLDNTVCGSTERDRDQAWACDRILHTILPQGSRLTVSVTRDGGGTWWRKTYVGTGERIIR